MDVAGHQARGLQNRLWPLGIQCLLIECGPRARLLIYGLAAVGIMLSISVGYRQLAALTGKGS